MFILKGKDNKREIIMRLSEYTDTAVYVYDEEVLDRNNIPKNRQMPEFIDILKNDLNIEDEKTKILIIDTTLKENDIDPIKEIMEIAEKEGKYKYAIITCR
jgi:nitrogen regulatory protein PII-like uncharacterized protein